MNRREELKTRLSSRREFRLPPAWSVVIGALACLGAAIRSTSTAAELALVANRQPKALIILPSKDIAPSVEPAAAKILADHRAVHGLNYYAAARLNWNPYLTAREILDDYCQSGFGEGSEAVARYFLKIQEISDDEEKTFSPKVIQELRERLDEADRAVGNDETILARIAFLRTGLNFTDVQMAVNRIVDLAKEKDPAYDPGQTRQLLELNYLMLRDIVRHHHLAVNAGYLMWGNGDYAAWSPIKGRGFRPETERITTYGEGILAPPPAPPTDPARPMWDMAELSKAPQTWPADGFSGEGVKAVFYQGLPHEGRETRVFAWIGLPDVPAGAAVPGVVLIHGGGGTAFDSWVRRWTSRGYAAIAMDTCGCVPKGSYGHWETHERGGPPGWGGWDQIDEPREDQWTYHAVADAILAHSLLLSLPEVDTNRTGFTGISWGGYLSCIVAGVDHRFKFAVPVYGCGFTNEHTFAARVNALGPERGARWMRWWDPSVYLPDASLPICWVTGSNDFAYTFNALQKSYRLPTGPRTLCIRLRMPHGHGDAGEGPKEIFTFADSMVKGSAPLPRWTGQGREAKRVWATFESPVNIDKAELNVTRDTGRWPDRRWEALPAQVDASGRVTATLPEGVTVYYLNLFDNRDCVVSTEHVEIANDATKTVP